MFLGETTMNYSFFKSVKWRVASFAILAIVVSATSCRSAWGQVPTEGLPDKYSEEPGRMWVWENKISELERLRKQHSLEEQKRIERLSVLWPPGPSDWEDRWWEPRITYHDGVTFNVRNGGKHVRDFRFHEDVGSIAFSADGLLYCGLKDGTVRVVDIVTGDERDKFRLGHEAIQSLAVSQSGEPLQVSQHSSPQSPSHLAWMNRYGIDFPGVEI
jgi:hypothetical protein